MNRKQWLDERRKGIGGSDAPIVMGCGYSGSSRLELWQDKVGLSEMVVEETEQIMWGRRLEAHILSGYQESSGNVIVINDADIIEKHPCIPYMICTPDAWGFESVIEVKNVSEWQASEWEKEAPEKHRWQLLHNIYVTHSKWGTLVALIGGNRLVWYDYYLDDMREDLHRLLYEEARFWHLVETETPPEVEPDTPRAAVIEDEDSEAEPVMLSDEGREYTDMYDEYYDYMKTAEEEVKRAKVAIVKEMGSATKALMPDGSGWTLKANKHGNRVLRRFR